MELQDEDIDEFRRLYDEEFGEQITREDAREHLQNVLGILLLLTKPTTTPRTIGCERSDGT